MGRSREMINLLWQALLLYLLKKKVMCFCFSVPVGDAGSEAMDPSLLMVLITKCFSRVKFVSPTLSELSITKTMSRAPQCFSQSQRGKTNKQTQEEDKYVEGM